MYKTEFVRARIEPRLKARAHAIFDKLGVTPTQVINMLYKQVEIRHAIPFEVSLPNVETTKAIKEARKHKGVVICKDEKDLFDKLGI